MKQEKEKEKVHHRWIVDRHIPIVLIFTLAMQTGGFIWWASALAERVNVLEKTVLSRESLPERMARVETTMDLIRGSLDRIERRLVEGKNAR